MTATPFDFRKPPPGEPERRASAWLTNACRAALAAWAKVFPFPVEWQVTRVDPVTAAVGIASLPADALGFGLTAKTTDLVALLALPRPLVLALVGGLLGDVPAAFPDDRDLSGLELSVCNYLIGELILGPLNVAWPVAETPPLAMGPTGRPLALWRVPVADPAILATITLTMPFGSGTFDLLMLRSGRVEDLLKAEPPPTVVQTVPREEIEALVREMPVDLSVILGTADLTLHDLAMLKTGDVVMLGQKVSDPLDAEVSGARKFRVWPGAVGTRHAIQIQATEGW